MRCKDDCLNRGICGNNGKCSCFPGYAGETCEIYIPCPLNCTDENHGTC